MKSRKLINYLSLHAVVVLVAFSGSQPGLADCVQSDPPADLVFSIDANNGCSDIQGQEGCTIKNALGNCTYTDPNDPSLWFKVYSKVNTDGSLGWELDALSTITGVDTFITGGGAQGKNNCGYGFKYDESSGFGGDCKAYDQAGNCTSFQNFTSLDVCTDGVTEEAPPPPPEPIVAKPLEYCQAPGSTTLGRLDDTGIECPLMEDENGNCLEYDAAGNCKQKPVVVCNLEKDKYAWGTTGSDVEGGEEQVCCQCGISTSTQTACFVSEDPAENSQDCAQTLTSDPAEDVVLTFQKDGDDPCYTKYSGGKPYKVCW